MTREQYDRMKKSDRLSADHLMDVVETKANMMCEPQTQMIARLALAVLELKDAVEEMR